MCLALPMRIVKIDGPQAVVEAAGVRLKARLEVLPEAAVGDYVLVHAGLAIARVDPQAAADTLALIRKLTHEIQ